MTVLLRVASFLANAAIVSGAAVLLGAGWPVALAACIVFFAWSWWACGRPPPSTDASTAAVALAEDLARRMGAQPPRAVRMINGCTAAAARRGAGYVLFLGRDVGLEQAEALLAHEVAHAVAGDLLWEPFTDGPARLLVPVARAIAPVWIIVFPFLLLGAPLARRTELWADALAARAVPSYPSVLKEFTAATGGQSSVLYPSIGERVRQSARHSSVEQVPTTR